MPNLMPVVHPCLWKCWQCILPYSSQDIVDPKGFHTARVAAMPLPGWSLECWSGSLLFNCPRGCSLTAHEVLCFETRSHNRGWPSQTRLAFNSHRPSCLCSSGIRGVAATAWVSFEVLKMGPTSVGFSSKCLKRQSLYLTQPRGHANSPGDRLTGD